MVQSLPLYGFVVVVFFFNFCCCFLVYEFVADVDVKAHQISTAALILAFVLTSFFHHLLIRRDCVMS